MEFPRRLGGALALDFVNTLDPRVGPELREFLVSPSALQAWAASAGVLINARLPTSAELSQAIALREALYRSLRAVAHRREPAGADLESIHGAVLRALAVARLAPIDGGYRWRVAPAEGVQAILLPILESALELFRTPERVKECAGENCGWLFVDTSRNASRRWCRMDGCGARAKMRRYRTRQRG